MSTRHVRPGVTSVRICRSPVCTITLYSTRCVLADPSQPQTAREHTAPLAMCPQGKTALPSGEMVFFQGKPSVLRGQPCVFQGSTSALRGELCVLQRESPPARIMCPIQFSQSVRAAAASEEATAFASLAIEPIVPLRFRPAFRSPSPPRGSLRVPRGSTSVQLILEQRG